MRYITRFAETRGTRTDSDLREATGSWLGHNVIFNPGSETVILDRSVAVATVLADAIKGKRARLVADEHNKPVVKGLNDEPSQCNSKAGIPIHT